MSESSTTPAASATTQRKPRSLADLVEEQVKGGLIDPSEATKPVDWRERSRGTSSGGGGGGGSGGGSTGRWNESRSREFGNNNSSTAALSSSSSLNWQQKELLGQSSSRNQQSGGGGFQGGGRSRANNGGQFSSSNLERRGGGNNNQGRGGGGFAKSRDAPKSQASSDLPEWATGLESSTADDAAAGLNWQQKSLMNRDESNPFNRLVRGEDEYLRE